MSKPSSIYICQQCGYQTSTYLGKCPECDTWNSLVETIGETQSSKVKGQKYGSKESAEIINISSIRKTDYKRLDTGLEEFNRVLGGGIVPGSIILVAGDPGIGKSTLLTQVALNTSPCLYIAGEESARQIKLRVERMNPKADLAVLNETDVDVVVRAVRDGQRSKGRWGLVIVDSIQTLETTELQSVAGSIGQVRECAHRLQKLAKMLHLPIFLVGHVNKDGMIAGPKTLEHTVDVVLSLEGDPSSGFRVLRGNKNRFGPTEEVGIFEMTESGMSEVKNPSKIFLEQKISAPGSAVVPVLSGTRPLLVEIQALVTKSFLPMPKRVGSGVDNNRLQLLVAVLMKRCKLSLFDKDIFVNVTGGLKVYEPAADLGICMAIVSSLLDKVISPKAVFIGEVGLLGEVRKVRAEEKRVLEANKLGFSKVISYKAKSLSGALKLALNE